MSRHHECVDLPGWPTVRAWIAASFANVTTHGDRLMRFDLPREPRRLRVLVRWLDDDAWVFFGIKVCPASVVPPVRALEQRAFSVGALAVIDDTLVIAQLLPLRGLTSDTVRATLEALATGRAAIRAERGAARQAGGIFDHYAE